MDTQVAEILGGERVLGLYIKSNLDLARATRQGLPTRTVRELARLVPGDATAAMLGFLGTGSRLSPTQSDLVVRIAGAFAKAVDVLGTKKKAAHWLTTPNRALGGEIPIQLLDTSAGAHEVESILDRIEYSVYS